MQPLASTPDKPEKLADEKEIFRAIELLCADHTVTELRVLNARDGEKFCRTVSGYFDREHRQLMAEVAGHYSGQAPSVYLTLNSVKPDLLARARNRAVHFAKATTSDDDIVRRVWLFVDLDPCRPSGISATEGEKAASLKRAHDVRGWLTEQGWPEPILADSGNGSHLLYRIDLPNDSGATALVGAVLRTLKNRWSDDVVAVDDSVSNAARICKLYGTLSAKGDHTTERPHRLSRILETPSEIRIVSRDRLELLGNQQRRSSKVDSAGMTWPANDFDVAGWLEKNGFEIVRTKRLDKNGAESVLYELAHCPWRPGEKDGGPFVIQGDDGSVSAGCHHNSCSERGWRDLKALVADSVDAKADAKTVGILPLEAFDDPYRLAGIVFEVQFSLSEGRTLVFWRDRWHRFNGRIWTAISERDLESSVSRGIKQEFDRLSIDAQRTRLGKPTAQKVTVQLVRNVIHAMRGLSYLDNALEQPCWLSDSSRWDAREVFVAKNGLVHLPSLAVEQGFLGRHTRDFFSSFAVDYDVLPEPQPIDAWQNFLRTIWENDQQSIDFLQEWFGYCLTADTRQQKMLLLLGPPRSGKGTIAHLLCDLIGRTNAVTPTLASLSQEFGLQPWLDKSLAIFSDARLDRRVAGSVITERLLSISGGDSLTINVKFAAPVTTVLPTRIMILTNELFQLRDASGALASRLMILPMKNSFLGKEDVNLRARLTAELPGILRWAVSGWTHLRQRGKFIEPPAAVELRTSLRRLSSPVLAFLDECCILGPMASVPSQELYSAFRDWSEEHGHSYVLTEEMFGRDLSAALPGLERSQERVGQGRRRLYRGVMLPIGFGSISA